MPSGPEDFGDLIRMLDTRAPTGSRPSTPKVARWRCPPAARGGGQATSFTHDYLVHPFVRGRPASNARPDGVGPNSGWRRRVLDAERPGQRIATCPRPVEWALRSAFGTSSQPEWNEDATADDVSRWVGPWGETVGPRHLRRRRHYRDRGVQRLLPDPGAARLAPAGESREDPRGFESARELSSLGVHAPAPGPGDSVRGRPPFPARLQPRPLARRFRAARLPVPSPARGRRCGGSYADDTDLPVFLPLPAAPAGDPSREAVPDPRGKPGNDDPTQRCPAAWATGGN